MNHVIIFKSLLAMAHMSMCMMRFHSINVYFATGRGGETIYSNDWATSTING